MNVVELDAVDTHELRRRVLRGGDPSAGVTWTGDDAAGTVHLGIRIDGAIVAVSTWLVDGERRQLRGMATDPSLQGTGLGGRVLLDGIERARRDGAREIWANVRVPVIGFYERYGFVVSGPVFTTPDTGLAHRLAVFDLR